MELMILEFVLVLSYCFHVTISGPLRLGPWMDLALRVTTWLLFLFYEIFQLNVWSEAEPSIIHNWRPARFLDHN